MRSSGKRPTRKYEPETTNLWGGALCLDFANTVDWLDDEPMAPDTDVLRDAEDARGWGRRLGVFDTRPPAIDKAEIKSLHALRLAIYRSFAAVARRLDPAPSNLKLLTHGYTEGAGHARLVRDGAAWRLQWHAQDPRRLRFAIIADAIGLLGDSERLKRVKRCPGRGCGWLFLDMSGRRRWCSMQTCGSREKMRRLYERRRAI
jgi:predicted RNA-binding Zn ribbon-like protein